MTTSKKETYSKNLNTILYNVSNIERIELTINEYKNLQDLDLFLKNIRDNVERINDLIDSCNWGK